ncbi:MAG: hypothetical protein IJI14_03050 [Anaerolineaceae bacterium]|nr:hypothetical protein [Anaerolineaceae bacterium]
MRKYSSAPQRLPETSDSRHSVPGHYFQTFCALSALGGLTALFFTFAEQSEAKSALFAGYSLSRWLLGLFTALLSACLILLLVRDSQSGGSVSKKVNAFLCRGDRAFFAFLSSLLGLFFSLWAFRFSWLFVPKNLRPLLLWFAFSFLLAAILLLLGFHDKFKSENVWEKYRLLPRLRDLSKIQKKSLLILFVISLVYILVLMPSNINGTRDQEDFQAYGGDEVVIYPILQAVSDPGDSYSQWLYHHYIHEDYHYGYPFYAVSYAVLLPFRVILGPDFMQRVDLTVPVLRVMVSVVPLMLGCLILVFLTTRFEHPLLSSAVYIFLLTAPGSLQNNQGFWHPDGLNFFFVCAALYFLQRDRLRFGRNFYLCAFFVGLSAAIRLFGFFFFLAVFVCLLCGVLRKQLTLKKAIVKGLLFILVMFGTILWSSPFLFRADARQNMAAILTEKTGEMSSGYNADFNDPKNDYRPGWVAWYPAFEDHFTEMYCFFFLIVSLLTACFIGQEPWTFRIIFLWWIVVAVYLIWFVAVKSTQYVLPMMLPLMSCIFALPRALRDIRNKSILLSARVIAAAVFTSQLIINLIKIAPRFQ